MKIDKVDVKEYFDREYAYIREYEINNPVDKEMRKRNPKVYDRMRGDKALGYARRNLAPEIGSCVYIEYLHKWSYEEYGMLSMQDCMERNRERVSDETYGRFKLIYEKTKKCHDSSVDFAKTVRKSYENEYSGLMRGMELKTFKNALKKYKQKKAKSVNTPEEKMAHVVLCEENRIIRCFLKLRKEYEEYISGKYKYYIFNEDERDIYKDFVNRIDNCFANLDLEKPILSQLMDTAKFIADNELPYDDDFLENEMVVHALILKECMDTHEQRFKEYARLVHFKGDYFNIKTTSQVMIETYLQVCPDKERADALNHLVYYYEPFIMPQ